MQQRTRYISSIIIIIMITFSLVTCSTNNEANNTKEVKQTQVNQEIHEEDRNDNQQPTENNVPNDSEANKIESHPKKKYEISNNTRINEYFKINKDTSIINFDDQLMRSFDVKNNEIDFITEIYNTDKKTIHTQPLKDDEKVFCVSDRVIGINSNKGLSLMDYNADFNGVYSYPILLDEDLTKAIGKKIYSFEDDIYTVAEESKYFSINFIEYVKNTLTYLISFDINDVKTYKMPLEGYVLDILKLANNDFVVAVKLNDNKVRLKVINYKCETKWTSDYNLEEGMEFKGLTISTYNSFDAFFSYSDMYHCKMVRYDINKKDVQSIYEIPVSLEYISEQYNTYFFVGIDKSNTKKLYVCDKNFVILDQIDFGTNNISKISNLIINRTFKEDKAQSVMGLIECDDEAYLFEIELMMKESRKSLFNINKEDIINIDPSNHMNYIFDSRYASSNFNNIIEITDVWNKPYFIANNTLYHYVNDLITKVREWDMTTDNIEVVETVTNCYAFYKDNKYVFTHSVLNNHQEEMYYNKMLSGNKKPLEVYFDRKNNEVLIRDSISLYTLGKGKDKNIICDNYNELELVGDISIYKNGSIIFIYDSNTFYSYDESTNMLIRSEIHTDSNMDVFNNNGEIVLYADNQVYHYDVNTHKLIRIPLPEISHKDCIYKVETGKLIMNDYYYDSSSKSFVKDKSIQPKIFEGVIDGKYYSHVLGNELGNDSFDIVLYATPFVHYDLNGQEIKLVDYKIKDGTPYIIEYETNYLYKIKDGNIVKVLGNSIEEYDISNKYLVYNSNDSNDQLHLYYIDDDYEEIICDDSVDDIYIDETNIYYCNLNDNNLYRYNIKSKEHIKLTETGSIYNVHYLKDRIIYSYENRIYLMNKGNFEIDDIFEGNISLVNEKDNEIVYDCSDTTLIYNMTTKKNEVISYDSSYYSFSGFFGDKAVVYYYDGPGELSVENYRDFKSVFDVIKYKMNEIYTIVDAGYMYGMKFYVYDNETMKHHKLLDSRDDYNEKELWDGEDPVIIYHDDDSIYFQKSDDTATGYQWVKYTPSTDKEEILDDVDTKGLNRIVGKPRGA